MSVIRTSSLVRDVLLGAAVAAISFSANAQEKHYRFAYDQPNTTGYGVAGDIFANKMKELSKGQFLVDQYPGAQLGQVARDRVAAHACHPRTAATPPA